MSQDGRPDSLSSSALGLAYRVFAGRRSRLPVLCFHGLWTAPAPHFGDKLFMSDRKFVSRLELIRSLGLQVLPLPRAMAALHSGTLPARAIAITIDDGWASTFTHMVPQLERFGYPATIYLQTALIESGSPVTDVAIRYLLEKAPDPTLEVTALAEAAGDGVTALVADLPAAVLSDRRTCGQVLETLFERLPPDRHAGVLQRLLNAAGLDGDGLRRCRAFELGSPDEVADAWRRGFEIALHTHTHGLGDFSRARVDEEIRRNRTALAAMLGEAPERFTHFCWPSGRYTGGAVQVLEQLGITLATTCDPGLVTRNSGALTLPRFLDGERVSASGFVLEVSGLKPGLRAMVSRLRGTATSPAQA